MQYAVYLHTYHEVYNKTCLQLIVKELDDCVACFQSQCFIITVYRDKGVFVTNTIEIFNKDTVSFFGTENQ